MSDSGKENLISRGPYETTVQPMLAEFVGVCLFVFIGCMASQNPLLELALAQGLTITLLIIGLGAISGGHFNPAVTLGVLLAGAIRPALAWCYFIAQLLGGVLGAALARGMMPSYIYQNVKGGSHSLGSDMEPGWAILAEAVLTTLLVLTILMSSVNRASKSSLAPVAIGFAVAMGVLSGGLTTGASMNPARALGPALMSSAVVSDSFDNHYVWWFGPLLGGLVAGVLYSGGHFNPAVSLGVTLAGAINPELAIGYIIGQLLGGLLGATIVRVMLPSHVYKNIKGGNNRLGNDMESSQAILGEAILTTALVFTFLMSSVNRRTKSNLASLAIGFAVAVDIISGGLTTGASMNPARALGPAIVSYAVMDDSFDDLFVWWVGPLLGGLVAGLLYR